MTIRTWKKLSYDVIHTTRVVFFLQGSRVRSLKDHHPRMELTRIWYHTSYESCLFSPGFTCQGFMYSTVNRRFYVRKMFISLVCFVLIKAFTINAFNVSLLTFSWRPKRQDREHQYKKCIENWILTTRQMQNPHCSIHVRGPEWPSSHISPSS